MDASSTVKNKFSTNRTQVSLEQREHTMYLLMIITSILLITVNYIFYFFIKFDDTKTYIISLLLTLFLPFSLNIYSVLYHIHFQEKRTEAENLEELEKEISSEKSNIPIILFGLGVFITKLDKKHILTIFPFLMVSLFFGTIMPEFLNTLIFDHYDLYRMTVSEEIKFAIITLSYGFLIMSIYLTTNAYLSHKFIK
jgi:hypothetical protein